VLGRITIVLHADSIEIKLYVYAEDRINFSLGLLCGLAGIHLCIDS
jgi:hypothetical protein